MGIAKVNFEKPFLPFMVDDVTGDVVGFEITGGKRSFIPAGGVDNALTAFASGGQASALQLRYRKSRVTTVATGGDSVKLPKALAGMQMSVINAAAANAMDVFPSTGEIINALSANTALSVVANKHIIFSCVVNGTWNSLLTA